VVPAESFISSRFSKCGVGTGYVNAPSEVAVPKVGTSLPAILLDRQGETVAEFVCVGNSWHDVSLPGNELPGYYPTSLRDIRFLSPGGAIESSPVL
jgi:hypothetical protein